MDSPWLTAKDTVHPGGEVKAAGARSSWSCFTHSQEQRERAARCGSAPLLHFTGFQNPSQGNGNTYSGPVFLPQCNKDDPPQACLQAHLPGSLNFIYLLFMCMGV